MATTHVCTGRIVYGTGVQEAGTQIDASEMGAKALQALLDEGRLITIKKWELQQKLAAMAADDEAAPEALDAPDPPEEVGPDLCEEDPLVWGDIADDDPGIVKTKLIDAMQAGRKLNKRSLQTGIRQAKTYDEQTKLALIGLL